MSKIIDTLLKSGTLGSRGAPKAAAHKTSESATAAVQAKNIHPKTRTIAEQLAGVYFQNEPSGSVPEAQKSLPPPPTIIQITETGRSFVGPWVVTTLLLILLMLLLASDKRLSVSVRFSDRETPPAAASRNSNEKSPDDSSATVPPPFDANRLLDANRLPEALFIPATRLDFFGAASLHSSKDRSTLNIANSSLSSIAYAALDFEKPFQAGAYDLYFEVRGDQGTEKMELILKDGNGNSSLGWRSLVYPASGFLSTEWRPVRLLFESAVSFDPNQLAQIRFEVGTQRTGNPPEARVQIRNIQFLPKTGA